MELGAANAGPIGGFHHAGHSDMASHGGTRDVIKSMQLSRRMLLRLSPVVLTLGLGICACCSRLLRQPSSWQSLLSTAHALPTLLDRCVKGVYMRWSGVDIGGERCTLLSGKDALSACRRDGL